MLKYELPDEIDSVERTIAHKEIIYKKKFLRELYIEWYHLFLNEMPHLPPGIMVELGSGGGFLKEIEPSIICSDILDLPTNDLTFSALDMPFNDNEVSAIFMIDTFHHIPDSEQFLNDAYRVLKKDGMIIMVEPANTMWGRFIYKNFHHEPFKTDSGWKIPEAGPLSGANGALPWIVFNRDVAQFQKLFPKLKLLNMDYHSPLTYLISGGVSIRQMLPDICYTPIRKLDKILSSISSQLSMFVTISLKKTGN